jgi:transposase
MDERVRFVGRLLDGESMSDVCREFGIWRKTGYKIFNRYRDEGLEALSDRSRRPVRYANQLPDPIERMIVAAKKDKPHWGARKIRELLVRKLDGDVRIPARSTVHAVLDRHGLVAHARRRHRFKAAGTELSQAHLPNDLWCVDFKGEFKLGDGRYCYYHNFVISILVHQPHIIIRCSLSPNECTLHKLPYYFSIGSNVYLAGVPNRWGLEQQRSTNANFSSNPEHRRPRCHARPRFGDSVYGPRWWPRRSRQSRPARRWAKQRHARREQQGRRPVADIPVLSRRSRLVAFWAFPALVPLWAFQRQQQPLHEQKVTTNSGCTVESEFFSIMLLHK